MSKHLVFWNKCEDCGYEFQTLSGQLGDSTRLLLSVKTAEPALVDWLTDEEFDRVFSLVRSLLDPDVYTSWKISEIGSVVFGRICDLASDGSAYNMSGKHFCINSDCGSTNVHYGPTCPPVYSHEKVNHVTHTKWDELTEEQKLSHTKRILDVVDVGNPTSILLDEDLALN